VVKLLGIDLPRNKKIEYALTSIHGIGLISAKKIVRNSKIDVKRRTNELTTEEIIILRNSVESTNLKLEGDLKRFNNFNIKRLNDINCYRGIRHRNNLPVHGQRTRTNARTKRGSKKTVARKKK
jgi:small subunit ribosomal protein S13